MSFETLLTSKHPRKCNLLACTQYINFNKILHLRILLFAWTHLTIWRNMIEDNWKRQQYPNCQNYQPQIMNHLQFTAAFFLEHMRALTSFFLLQVSIFQFRWGRNSNTLRCCWRRSLHVILLQGMVFFPSVSWILTVITTFIHLAQLQNTLPWTLLWL